MSITLIDPISYNPYSRLLSRPISIQLYTSFNNLYTSFLHTNQACLFSSVLQMKLRTSMMNRHISVSRYSWKKHPRCPGELDTQMVNTNMSSRPVWDTEIRCSLSGQHQRSDELNYTHAQLHRIGKFASRPRWLQEWRKYQHNMSLPNGTAMQHIPPPQKKGKKEELSY